MDLGSLKSTREFAEDILKTESRLDILINNAGVGGFQEIYTEDGILKDMHINHFGSFLLTNLLIDILKKTPKSHVVFVSSLLSLLHQLKTVEDINRPSRLKNKIIQSIVHYSISKLCNIISVREFARRLLKHNISVNAVHPGMVRTSIFDSARKRLGHFTWIFKILMFLIDSIYWLIGKTAEEGAQTTLFCAIDKSVEGVSGQLFVDCKIYKIPATAADQTFSGAVWSKSEELVKLSTEEKLQY